MTSTNCSLLKGSRPNISSTTLFTGSRLVLRAVYCKDFVPILPVLLHLLVHDGHYVEFTEWASLPHFQYYSVHWFTTSTTCSLMQWPRSHTSSTTPFTSSRLVYITCSLLQEPRSHTSSTTPFTSSRLVYITCSLL
jgi:hypothetical protein